MANESIVKTVSVGVLSVCMLIFGFLFYERDEGILSLIFLFVGIILVLLVAASLFMKKQS